MCECLAHDDGSRHMCAACAPEYDEFLELKRSREGETDGDGPFTLEVFSAVLEAMTETIKSIPDDDKEVKA